MAHDDDDEIRSGQEAIEEMREKREDEGLSDGEADFLESERVRLDPADGGDAPVA